MSRRHAARPRLVVDNSSSSDNSIPRSGAKRNNFKCKCAGTISRSRHLRLASTLTPNSSASGSMRSQRSMPESMDILSGLSRTTSRVTNFPNWPQWDVVEKADTIWGRTQIAREDTGQSQAVMADLLGMETDAYAKYESPGRAIPSHRIPLFCGLTRKDPAWLLTGRRWPDSMHQEPSRARKKRKARKKRETA